MLARVISYNLANTQATEDILNEWLEEAGDIRIDRCVTLGNAGQERDHGAIVIFYEERAAPSYAGSPDEPLCRQCKKRPALGGMKSCEECRDYQKRYREQKKEEKKKARYP